jgi:CelD/BcsL family acetyltransferase involved in cellulose biosynthesis
MTEEFEVYFKNLLQFESWKIYFLQSGDEIISTAFCYENEIGCYLYNSSRNNKFNHLNPGIVLNDLITQRLIEEGKVFFDFLKGTERYKYDLGGNSVQLYDLAIEL